MFYHMRYLLNLIVYPMLLEKDKEFNYFCHYKNQWFYMYLIISSYTIAVLDQIMCVVL